MEKQKQKTREKNEVGDSGDKKTELQSYVLQMSKIDDYIEMLQLQVDDARKKKKELLGVVLSNRPYPR